MRYSVIVKANASKNEIISFEKNVYKVSIKAVAKDGKANLELVKFMSKKLGKKIKLVSGFTSKTKMIEALD
jgi:uncharacterized protein